MLQRLLRRVRALGAPTDAPPRTGRALQLQLDSQRLCALLADKSLQHAAARQQARALDAHLGAQLRRVLGATHGALLDRSDTPIERVVRAKLGYAPVIARSRVAADAGNGLFVSGRAGAGCVLALFPGVFYQPSELPQQLSDLAIARYDGVVIDSSHEISINVTFDEKQRKQLYHPFGTAHYANHGTPNALQFLLDVRSGALPAHLRHLMPVRRAMRSGARVFGAWADLAMRQRVEGVEMFTKQGDDVLRTVALVALRDIEHDEEVLFNYRFNPNVTLPEWYSDPEPRISERRWHSSSRGALF